MQSKASRINKNEHSKSSNNLLDFVKAEKFMKQKIS